MDADPARAADPAPRRARVRVRGAVQGVGFRPFVTGLARDLALGGWVLNDSDGVLLEVEGGSIAEFLARLRTEPPPLARIDDVAVEAVSAEGTDRFEIRKSAKGAAARTAITPDAATCPACLDDIFDPTNRRYRYAFTNCTHCGPRYTITRALPYDRAQTSMAPFAMCPSCDAEYEDDADRRFHAQPNACADCGPRLTMEPEEIVDRLTAGQILAIKGLGGFHLAADARNEAAVATLRARKGRDGKPFAVMVPGLASARMLAEITEAEAAALTDRARPIVVCRARSDSGLAPSVSDGLATIGLMLTYTPLHALLFHDAAGRPDGTAWMETPQPFALVMTSANPGGEPLVVDDVEARLRLDGIADAYVGHDREIVVRCDDSVVRVINGAPAYLRRARGATPEPIRLPRAVPPILAVGAHLKTTVCVTRGDEAFLSQHIGDLDDAATRDFFHETIDHLTSILEVTPERIACDLHPDFYSTRYAEETGLPITRVQHHHAHLAGVVAEHALEYPVVGLALDGYGLGDDGASSWGGELMVLEGGQARRLAGFAPLAQPGGDAAARQPWRMGAAALHALGRGDEIAARYADHSGAPLLAAMLERGVNAPLTSSAGRLFDAACGLLGVRPHARFEGEAPMRLEALVRTPRILQDGWRIGPDGVLDMRPLLAALVDADPVLGAELFHGTLAAALIDWAAPHIEATGGARHVALSGGCLQNKVLAEALIQGFAALGVAPLLPRRAPANDGGLSLGQAWVAAERARDDARENA